MTTAQETRRNDYLDAYGLAEKIVDDAIRRGAGLTNALVGTPIEQRVNATIRLAEWLLGDNPVIGAATKAAELLDDGPAPTAVFAANDPLAGYGLIPGHEALAWRTALRHLATVANGFILEPGVLTVGRPNGLRQTFDTHYDHEIPVLDQAITEAYEALGWPRYPEPDHG